MSKFAIVPMFAPASIVCFTSFLRIESLRRNLQDWLTDMDLVPAGAAEVFDRFLGYYEPYATNHEALDRDTAFMEEAGNVFITPVAAIAEMRQGRRPPGDDLESQRQK